MSRSFVWHHCSKGREISCWWRTWTACKMWLLNNGFFWRTLLHWPLVFEQYVGNNSPFPHARTHAKHTHMMPVRSACHPSSAKSGGSQVEGILESRGYWLWLGTVCALHSKWAPLPYHLWVINVQSVGLSFVIGHSDTVQFSSQPRASLRELGSSLNPSAPPPPSPCLRFMNHTGTLVNECLLLSRLKKDVIVTRLSHVLSLFRH